MSGIFDVGQRAKTADRVVQSGGRFERNVGRDARLDKPDDALRRRKSLGDDAAGADLGTLLGKRRRGDQFVKTVLRIDLKIDRDARRERRRNGLDLISGDRLHLDRIANDAGAVREIKIFDGSHRRLQIVARDDRDPPRRRGVTRDEIGQRSRKTPRAVRRRRRTGRASSCSCCCDMSRN